MFLIIVSVKKTLNLRENPSKSYMKKKITCKNFSRKESAEGMWKNCLSYDIMQRYLEVNSTRWSIELSTWNTLGPTRNLRNMEVSLFSKLFAETLSRNWVQEKSQKQQNELNVVAISNKQHWQTIQAAQALKIRKKEQIHLWKYSVSQFFSSNYREFFSNKALGDSLYVKQVHCTHTWQTK